MTSTKKWKASHEQGVRPVKPLKRWLLLALALPLLCVAGVVAYDSNRALFPRLDLPPFDAAKGAQLTPEKRAAYEQELFSQLQLWNRGSRHYPTVQDIGRRERRWQAMADDGFELAHITLRVLKPEGGLVYSLAGPMKRLEELAKAGDVGAMCLMPGLVNRASNGAESRRYEALYKPWLFRGVELGHPQCLTELGGRTLREVPNFLHNVKQGLELEFAARRAGYAHDVGSLILHYQDKGYGDPANVQRLYCWLQIEDDFWFAQGPQRLLADLRRQAAQTSRPELFNLVNELEAKKYTLRDCVNLGEGD